MIGDVTPRREDDLQKLGRLSNILCVGPEEIRSLFCEYFVGRLMGAHHLRVSGFILAFLQLSHQPLHVAGSQQPTHERLRVDKFL